jgi:ADP-ribose pyrophosphatase YjhB (NUDIX family)
VIERYCVCCGAPLAEGVRFGRLRKYCRFCGHTHFREPKVAVAALLNHRDCVLLVRRAAEPRSGYWALPAGYMDGDELPEGALVREVLEETGLAVRPAGLHAVVPLAGWAERRGILVVYKAELLDPVPGCSNDGLIAQDDVSEVRWFTAADIPWSDLAFDTTAQFLRDWVSLAQG